MSHSIINSVELIPFIEEAIEGVQTAEDFAIKSLPKDFVGSLKFDNIKSNCKRLFKQLFDLQKLAKTNEVVHLSSDDAARIYDYSESFKNRLNKGYR